MGGLLCLYRCSFWRFFWQRLGPARSRQHPTVHRKVGLGCTNRQLVRGLFSYKNPTHQPGKLNTVQLRVTQRRANFSAGYKRDLALERYWYFARGGARPQALVRARCTRTLAPLPINKATSLLAMVGSDFDMSVLLIATVRSSTESSKVPSKSNKSALTTISTHLCDFFAAKHFHIMVNGFTHLINYLLVA